GTESRQPENRNSFTSSKAGVQAVARRAPWVPAFAGTTRLYKSKSFDHALTIAATLRKFNGAVGVVLAAAPQVMGPDHPERPPPMESLSSRPNRHRARMAALAGGVALCLVGVPLF